MKLILSEEEKKFLLQNAATTTDNRGETKFALPVFVRQKEWPDNMFSMIEGNFKEFSQINAQTYLDATVKDKGGISDGYHTFDELYDHRIMNFIVACRSLAVDEYAPVWKSKYHSDGTTWEGWFIMGINDQPGEQISYHLPMKYWDMTKFVKEYETAPPFDGHTSADVLARLKKLLEELD